RFRWRRARIDSLPAGVFDYSRRPLFANGAMAASPVRREKGTISGNGPNRVFPVPFPPYPMCTNTWLNTPPSTCPIAGFYLDRRRMPPHQQTPSCHYGHSHPLLFARHLCYRGRKFAADNRQCVYICFLDLRIPRELLAYQTGWPVQGCRIESRYAAT